MFFPEKGNCEEFRVKICPVCKQTYSDENINFCLNDGNTLVRASDDAPPTIFMDQARSTNQNWTGMPTDQQWQNQPVTNAQSFGVQGQNQGFTVGGQNQTLAVVSLILGISGILLFCCYGGIPLGVGAIITGYLALNNIKQEPMIYSGNGMAIGGIVTGIIGFLATLVIIIIAIFSAR